MDFLWGEGNLDHKPHLVKWSTICIDKKKGGLGVRSLSKLNKALLCKWNRHFSNERDALWRDVIRRKYEEILGGWCMCEIRGGCGIGIWKEIRKEWKTLLPNAMFLVGDGRRGSFWKDFWCGEEALCTSFPLCLS